MRFPALALALALPALLAVAACGQVTGLSDDYTYDLEGGAVTADGGGDGAATDGPTADADAGFDATNKCTTAQTVTASKKLNNNFNGTQLCKTCLATGCCSDVEICTATQECSRLLGCKLDCTEKQQGERPACFNACTLGGSPPSPVFQSGVAMCAAGACAKECGFQ